MGYLCTGSYRGVPPLVRPTKGVGRPMVSPTFFPLFQWCLMTATWSKNEWMGAGVGRCSLGVAPNALGHENHPSSCMHYTPNFCGCHFVPKLPLGHLSNSKFHGGLWCKRWENKTCKGFHAKDAMLMQRSNEIEGNSNMHWLKSNMMMRARYLRIRPLIIRWACSK